MICDFLTLQKLFLKVENVQKMNPDSSGYRHPQSLIAILSPEKYNKN